MSIGKIKIGAVTIGQSPRVDITEDIKDILGDEFEIVERGALDAYDYEYVSKYFYPEKGDTILVSRMRDGSQVKIGEEKIIPLLQECIGALEKQGCQMVLMLCTGKFPEFQHNTLLIRPQEMLQLTAQKLSDGSKIGVIIPDGDQADVIKHWWGRNGVEVELAVASPYKEWNNIIKAAETFKDKNVALIFMDCMGYSVKMKKSVREISGKPVLLARTLTARIVKELFE
ncbi:MAG: AroM family protein [Lutisporaceae bacterium]